MRDEFAIPEGWDSCHIAEIEGYYVEGHMPLEAITKLLEERPDIDGIILPGMPQGSPGMEGDQREPFIIYAITGGIPSEFMTVE